MLVYNKWGVEYKGGSTVVAPAMRKPHKWTKNANITIANGGRGGQNHLNSLLCQSRTVPPFWRGRGKSSQTIVVHCYILLQLIYILRYTKNGVDQIDLAKLTLSKFYCLQSLHRNVGIGFIHSLMCCSWMDEVLRTEEEILFFLANGTSFIKDYQRISTFFAILFQR